MSRRDRLLADFLEGDLSAPDARRLLEMLGREPSLAEELADLLQIQGLLASLPEDPPADLVVRQIQARLVHDPGLVDRVLERAAVRTPGAARPRCGTRRLFPLGGRPHDLFSSPAFFWSSLAAVAGLFALVLWTARPAPSPPSPREAPEAVLRGPAPAGGEAPARTLPPAAHAREQAPEAPAPPLRPAPVTESGTKKPPPVSRLSTPIPEPPALLAPPLHADPSRVGRTVAHLAAAWVENLFGEAKRFGGGDPVPLRTGEEVAVGHGVQTAPGAGVRLRLPEGIVLELQGNSRLGPFGHPGEPVSLEQGALAAQVPRRPAGRPMTFLTPHAAVTILGTRLTLRVEGDATRLDVQEGRVRLTRRFDGASVEVQAGQYAVAALAVDLAARRAARFVAGVNLNGRAVRIEGHPWLSYEEAQAAGLRFSHPPALTTTSVEPRPAADAETTAMLNTAVFRQGGDLGLSFPLSPGVYDVHLWVMENLQDDYRSFDISLEGRSAARAVGAGARRGEWARLGPFRTTVRDGKLEIELLHRKSDPHLMGFAVFGAAP